MANWQDFFKNKKVTVMGLGLLGRGVGDVKFLAEEGAELVVTDLKTEEQLKPSLDLLKEELGEMYNKITFALGEHDLRDFKGRDFILKAAGVSLDSVYIEEARKSNIPIEMSTALFAAFTPAKIVGITGTRGKSTATHLLFEILNIHYKKGRVFLGGNIKGVSTLELLRETKEGDIAVLELDSWQLQGFGERSISPHVSIFTTFFDDHLNYYKGDRDKYLADKANIFLYQKSGDSLILGAQAEKIVKEKYANSIKSKTIITQAGDVPEDWSIQIPGDHNKYNAALAAAAARVLEIPQDEIKKTVEAFKGVPGRLELIREVNGVQIYNDTNATTPDATLAGINALGEHTVLIMGGADKQLDMNKLLTELPKLKKVILLDGTGSSRIETELQSRLGEKLSKALTLKDAVDRAIQSASMGDAILFSPAFASFGLFKNEYDRGEQFNAIIEGIV